MKNSKKSRTSNSKRSRFFLMKNPEKKSILKCTEFKGGAILSQEKEKFAILLDQMKVDDQIRQHPLIQTGKLTQVVVHRQSKSWAFTLEFAQILPAMLYQTFKQHLEIAFRSIAEVQLKITALNSEFNEQLLQEYWPLALADQNCDTPLVKQVLSTQLPVLRENKYCLPATNEAVISILQQQYLPIIESNYQNFGFERLRIQAVLDEQQAQADLKELELRQQAQQEALMQQAAETIATQEQRKKEKKSSTACIRRTNHVGSKYSCR